MNRILRWVGGRFGAGRVRDVVAGEATGGNGQPATGKAAGKSKAKPSRLLIIEDDEDILQVLKLMLEDEGHVVIAAEDGQAALGLAAAASQPFDAVVTDISMPNVSGIDVARALRAGDKTADMRIVFHTGLDEHWVRERFADYDLFVTKSGDSDLLAGKITRLLTEPATPRAERPAPAAEPTFTFEELLRTQRSLRGATGAAPEDYSASAFIGLIRAEIEQLKSIGQSDAKIAALVGDVLQRDFSVSLIRKHAGPPDG